MDYAPNVRLKPIVFLAVLLLLAAPAGACAYTMEVTQAEMEAAGRSAQEAVERHEKELEAKAAEERKATEERKTSEERSQREAAERQQHEEAERAKAQHEEETGQAGEAAATAKQCVVPALKGDTLMQARQALRRAYCKLGRVTAPPHGHGRHVVTRQGLRAASKHPAGTAVAVTLGPVKLGR